MSFTHIGQIFAKAFGIGSTVMQPEKQAGARHSIHVLYYNNEHTSIPLMNIITGIYVYVQV